MTTLQARCVMNCRCTTFALPILVGLAACRGPMASGSDPQAPVPHAKQTAASSVFICPEGSAYDPGRNICIAASMGDSSRNQLKNEKRGKGEAAILIKCSFRNGWVGVVPEQDYPDDDEFIMQALIGFTEEPEFWSEQSEYKSLAQFRAKRCNKQGESFELAPGSYFVLVGEGGTFGRRNSYRNNGYRQLVKVTTAEPVVLDLKGTDLNHTWLCISCPHVSFFDPMLGKYLPSFVVLAYRDERRLRGTDRIVVRDVPVKDGKIRLRVAEVERETSYLDQLVLEVDGTRILPTQGGEKSALASIDGVDVEMDKSTQFFVEFNVPHVKTTSTTVTVVAHGHYEPTLP